MIITLHTHNILTSKFTDKARSWITKCVSNSKYLIKCSCIEYIFEHNEFVIRNLMVMETIQQNNYELSIYLYILYVATYLIVIVI